MSSGVWLYLKQQFGDLFMGLLSTKYACSCLWCFRKPDDSIPFWSPDTSDDNINNTSVEYSNDTFEDASKSALPLAKVHKPRIKYSHKGSESESDDSISIYLSETASDQSDVEGRIRALQEELKRRKLEVERLKREHKKNRREKLRQKEEQLKTKIEACDSYIQQVQVELQKERDQDPTTVKPQIKKPQAASKTAEDKSVPSGSPELKGKLVSLADRKTGSSKVESKTESVEQSYTEDITEDLPSYTDTFHKSENKLKLDLTEKEESKNEKEGTPLVEEKPGDTARSVTEIPEEVSVVTAPISDHSERTDKDRSRHVHSYTESEAVGRAEGSKRLTSYTETEEYSDQSERSYRSYSDYTDTSTLSKADRKSKSATHDKKDTVPTDEEISEQLSVPSVIETEDKSEEEEEEAPGLTFDLTAPTPVDESNKVLELSQEIVEDALPDKVSLLSQTENILSMKEEDFLIDLSAPQSQPTIKGEEEEDGDESMTSLDRAISSAENAVKGFVEEGEGGDKKQEEAETIATDGKKEQPSFVELLEEAENVEDLTQKQVVKERVSDIVTENLVNDALDTILDIRKKKGSSPTQEQVEDRSVPDKEGESGDEFGEVDIPLVNEVTVHPVEDIPLRPESPDIPDNKQTLEETDYDFDMHSDGFWEDIEISPKNEPERAVIPAEMKLDLQKLSEEVFYAVPNSLDDVSQLVDNTVDVYWEKRRFGETWDELEVPSTFYKSEDQGSDMESRSRKVYKHLLFDLAGEILTEMYEEEESPAIPPWEKPLPVRRKYHKGKNPPTVPGEVKPLVCNHVSKYLGLVKDNGDNGGRVSKLSGRKKKDNVDQILTTELREEEPDWVNYDTDELAVKLQLSDAIFDSLLLETGRIFSGIMPCKAS